MQGFPNNGFKLFSLIFKLPKMNMYSFKSGKIIINKLNKHEI